MAEKQKRTVWFRARLAVLLLVALAVASAGSSDWQVFAPGALLNVGGILLIFLGAFQWMLLAVLKRFYPAGHRSVPYSLSINPFSGKCFFVTGFIPYVVLAIAGGLSVAIVLDGFWPGFWHVGVLVSIGLFWIRWNNLIARRYCQ